MPRMLWITYTSMQQETRELSQNEQALVARNINAVVRRQIRRALRRSQPEARSILELRGLGKEMWRSIDSTAYLAEERNAWDG